jgi:hypothetical protein
MNINQLALKEIDNVVEALDTNFREHNLVHFSDYMVNDKEPFFDILNYIDDSIELGILKINNETEEGIAFERLALTYKFSQMVFGKYLENRLENSLYNEFKVAR